MPGLQLIGFGKKQIEESVEKLIGEALDLKNALTFKGAIDCSANPKYPAANSGDLWFISVGGKIGGSGGSIVEIGDILVCIKDGSASGSQAEVASNWVISQSNLTVGNAGEANRVLKADDPFLLGRALAGNAGEGAPAKGLEKGAFYTQLGGSGTVAIWEGQGAGKDAIERIRLGVLPDGSVTLATLSETVLQKLENNNSLFKIPRPPSGNLLIPACSQESSAVLGTKEVLISPAPLDIAVKTTTKSIEVYLEEAGEGTGQQVRLGVYADNGSGTMMTGLPLWDAGAISTLVGGKRVIEAEKTWEPGRYWPSLILQGALTKNPKFKTGNFIFEPLGRTDFTDTKAPGLKQLAAGAGALPAIGTLVPNTLTAVLIGLRVK